MSELTAQPCADEPKLKVVLGHCGIDNDEAQRLVRGHLVPLDEPIDWPVEIYIANRLIARGELLTLNEHFCVRVTEVIAAQSLARAA